MQLHTFIVESATEAVQRIRTELGPEAVVVSVRKLPPSGLSRLWKQEQVEVVAGVGQPAPAEADPIQQLREEIRDLRAQFSPAPAGEAARNLNFAPEMPSIASIPQASGGWRIGRLLLQTGLLPMYAEQIEQEIISSCGDRVPDQLSREVELARNYLQARWMARLPRQARHHIFVGPSGSGKSTVLCKMLANATLMLSEPASVYQLDTHLANPSPLPGIYAEILGASFERSQPLQWDAAEAAFIDLPGSSPSDPKTSAFLQGLRAALPEAETHLVLNAAYDTSILVEQARSWAAAGVSDLILTHLDEEQRWGKIWNLVMGTNFRVSYFSAGQNIPGEFLAASPERLFERQFGQK